MTGFRKVTKLRAVDISGRTPPHSVTAEDAIVSAVLADARCIDEVRATLGSTDDLHSEAHRRVLDVAFALHDRGARVDVVTVAEDLRAQSRLEAVGGVAFLERVLDGTPSVSNVGAHARIVVDKARARRCIEAAQMIAAQGYVDYGDAQSFLDSAAEQFANLAQQQSTRAQVALLHDVLRERLAALDEQRVDGVFGGLVDVDSKTTGMHPGELIVIAGRPGMGKSAYAFDRAVHVASAPQQGTTLGAMVFSLEMPKEQVADRMAASDARVNLQSIRHKQLAPRQRDTLIESMARLGQLPVWVDDAPTITVAELRAKVRRAQLEFNRRAPDGRWLRRIGLVVVDYLQLMTGDGDKREEQISGITRALKAAAKALEVPIVALSQLNRAVETRSAKDKRPQLSDLRESGAIEQDADVIQFIYRPEYYLQLAGQPVPAPVQGYAEVIVAKQRNGPTGRVPVSFLADYARFENRARNAPTFDSDDD